MICDKFYTGNHQSCCHTAVDREKVAEIRLILVQVSKKHLSFIFNSKIKVNVMTVYLFSNLPRRNAI